MKSTKVDTRRRPTGSRLLLPAILLATLFSNAFLLFVGGFDFNAFVMPEEDPYKVLGINIRDRNNMEIIKKAYREKVRIQLQL